MTLPFTPSEFGRPFTMVTAVEAADIVTVALHGPWVYQHQHPTAERREEAEKAQDQALLDMYGLLHDGDLIAYVEDPRSHRFLRVPTSYYVEDGWAFSRCFSLSKLQTKGIPQNLEEQPLLFLRSELDEWVASRARRASSTNQRSRGFDRYDEPILAKMKEWISNNRRGVQAASLEFAADAAGGGTNESKAKRLERKYVARFGEG